MTPCRVKVCIFCGGEWRLHAKKTVEYRGRQLLTSRPVCATCFKPWIDKEVDLERGLSGKAKEEATATAR